MGRTLKRSRWIRITAGLAAIYSSLWVATRVFGPEATRDLAQREHTEFQTRNGLNPASSKLDFTSISVPAPFIVDARWNITDLMPDGRLAGSGTHNESRTVWAFGWTRVVQQRNVAVFCGTPAPAR